MFREQVINFLEAALVLLTLTNAFSVAAAVYAVSLVRNLIRGETRPATDKRRVSLLSRWPRTRA